LFQLHHRPLELLQREHIFPLNLSFSMLEFLVKIIFQEFKLIEVLLIN